MPITSADGTIPAVGVASDTAPKMARERGREDEREEKNSIGETTEESRKGLVQA